MKLETIIGLIGLSILFVIIIAFLFIFVFQFRKRKIQFEYEKKNRELNFHQTLLQTQIEIQEQTLTNISQELHDNIGQTLSLAKLNLNTLKLQDTAMAQNSIDITKDLISQSLVNIRNLAKSMLGEKITEIGLQQSVQNELKILEQTGQYKINFNANENTNALTPQQELLAFRILQEALHNILKHAEATKINVQFNYLPTYITITITDNGIGFQTSILDTNTTGIGLKNMKNRASLMNAELEIESKIFQGTSFCLKIRT